MKYNTMTFPISICFFPDIKLKNKNSYCKMLIKIMGESNSKKQKIKMEEKLINKFDEM